MNTAIKTLAFLTIASFIFVGGCVSKLTTFNFDYKTKTSVSTGAFPTAGTHTFGESRLTSDLDSVLKAQGTSLDMLDELKLKSATFTITNPSGGNFDAVDNVELWISADGSPEVLLASKKPVAKGLNSVSLDVNSSEDLSNYLKAHEFTYRIKGTSNAALSPMDLNIEAIWGAKASKK
jgi:hypothetical protein